MTEVTRCRTYSIFRRTMLQRAAVTVGGVGLSLLASPVLSQQGEVGDEQFPNRIVMLYEFRLKGPEAIPEIRQRAARLGPTFIGYPGLEWKLYLIDLVVPTLAAFIVWRNPAAARRYLDAPEFDRQVKAFGRPQVRLLLPISSRLPPEHARTAILGDRSDPDTPVRCVDPFEGRTVSLSYSTVSGREFEIAYVVRPRG